MFKFLLCYFYWSKNSLFWVESISWQSEREIRWEILLARELFENLAPFWTCSCNFWLQTWQQRLHMHQQWRQKRWFGYQAQSLHLTSWATEQMNQPPSQMCQRTPSMELLAISRNYITWKYHSHRAYLDIHPGTVGQIFVSLVSIPQNFLLFHLYSIWWAMAQHRSICDLFCLDQATQTWHSCSANHYSNHSGSRCSKPPTAICNQHSASMLRCSLKLSTRCPRACTQRLAPMVFFAF